MGLNIPSAFYLTKRNLSLAMLSYLVIYFFTSMVLGRVLIEYNSVSLISIVCFFSCLLLFVIGSYLGEKTSFFIKPLISVSLLTFVKVISWFSFLFMLASWWFNYRHWGSFEYIITHAMTIRNSVIGGNGDFIPSYLGYLSSLSYVSFSAGLFLFHRAVCEKSKRGKMFFYLVVNIVSILLQDLLSFGRIGMVFTFFSIISYMFLFLPMRKIINKKNLIIVMVALVLVNAPRIVRGGGDMFMASLDDKVSSISVPLNQYNAGFVINYIYYFSSPYAFDYWLNSKHDDAKNYGERTFTPVFNIISKFVVNGERPQLIDDDAYIPFRHNIFSVAKDYYMDFGVAGVVILPLFFGFVFGRQSKLTTRGIINRDVNYINAMLVVFSLAYFIYAPLYNVFSFGKFLIPWLFMFSLSLFVKLRD